MLLSFSFKVFELEFSHCAALEGVWQQWKVYGSNGRCMVAMEGAMEGVWQQWKVYGSCGRCMAANEGAMEGVWQQWNVYGSNGRCNGRSFGSNGRCNDGRSMVAMEGVW